MTQVYMYTLEDCLSLHVDVTRGHRPILELWGEGVVMALLITSEH